MLEGFEAFLFATVLSVSGTDGRGGGAPVLSDPVRPAVVLEATGADRVSTNSPTEALVAPPLVSQGFGGDGADISEILSPHDAVVTGRSSLWGALLVASRSAAVLT